MTRATRLFWISALSAVLPAAASAAPPWLERLGEYRVVDASGRITPRADPDATGRLAFRPANPPSFLLRARPWYPAGYAGASYGPNAPALEPTGFYAGVGRKPCGHRGACRHGR